MLDKTCARCQQPYRAPAADLFITCPKCRLPYQPDPVQERLITAPRRHRLPKWMLDQGIDYDPRQPDKRQ